MKKKKYRYRYRIKFEEDSRWIPTAWATNSRREALYMAREHSNNLLTQVWDYETKAALREKG